MAKQLYNKSSKYFYENRAKLILMRFFSDVYSDNIICKDKPDLQDKTNSIGIEVTRAFISPIIPEQQSLWKQHKTLRVNKKAEAEYKKSHISYSCYDNKILVTMFWVSTEYLLESFVTKLKKLNDGLYDHYNYYDLFIYAQELNDEEDMPPLLDRMIMLQANCKIKYRTVYILEKNIIYCYNLKDEKFVAMHIDKKTL